MPLTYSVVPNALTTPPSFRASPEYSDVIDLEQMIKDLALRNPGIGSGVVSMVMSSLAQYIDDMLSEGKSVNWDGFLRFFHSIPGRLEADESALSSAVQVQCSVSTPFEQGIRQRVSLSRMPFIQRTPSIASVVDNGGILTLRGDGLDFDSSADNQGVFITNSYSGTSTRMTVYAVVTNTQVIGLSDFLASAVTTRYNEFLISAKARYTTNGSLRTGQYGNPLRSLRKITDDDDVIDDANVFYHKLDGVDISPLTVGAAYDNHLSGTVRFTLKARTDLSGLIRPESQIAFTVVNEESQSLDFLFSCYDNGTPVTSFTLSPLSLGNDAGDDEITSLTLTVSDIAEFWKVINVGYGGEIVETVEWVVVVPVT